MRNEQIKIDGVIIPYVITNEGEEYYPIKYIMEQFLLKTNCALHKKDNLKKYIQRYLMDYSFKNTVSQETYCMSKDGWVEYIKTCKKYQNKNEIKIKRLQLFSEYIGAQLKFNNLTHYDLYTIECIKDFKHRNPKVKDKCCVKCGRTFPNSDYFFNKDKRVKGGIINTCRECNGGYWLTDNLVNKYVFTTFGSESFEYFIKDKKEFAIDRIINSIGEKIDIRKMFGKENEINIILDACKRLIELRGIDESDISLDNIKPFLNIKDSSLNKLTNNMIIEYCIPDIRLRPWKCKKYSLGVVDKNEALNIFRTYLNDKEIVIEDIFAYKNWANLIKECRIRRQINNDLLGFVVDLYERKYAGYLFNIASSNYYKIKSNLIFDMKYLIEKDLRLQIEKIPLYITKYTLKQKSNTLYDLLRKENRIFKDLFEWIEACYPGKFIRSDFDLNPYRSRFDSLEEAQVYEELTKMTKGVIYNPRDDENRVEIMGMVPDFIIHTNKGCYLTEYFGLYSANATNSSRLQNYMRKHSIKIKKYKELEVLGYKNLFIYPEDLKNDFEGLRNKVKNII